MSQPVLEFLLVFLPPVGRVALDRAPDQTSGVPPIIQHNALLKRLPASGDRDDVVLVEISRITFGPVELERSQLQRIEPKEELVRVLITMSGFSFADVDEKTLNGGWRNHPPLSRQLPARGVGGEGDAPGFFGTNVGREFK